MTEQGSDNGASEADPEVSPDVSPDIAGRLEDHAAFAHVDDGFQRLWTPHRMAYIVGDKPTPRGSSSTGAPTATS